MATTRPRLEDSELTRFYMLFPEPGLARDLFNVIEGHRVDLRIRTNYPGIRRDMDAIRDDSAERRPSLASLGDAQAVVESMLQFSLGLETDMSDLASSVRAIAERAVATLASEVDPESTVEDSARLTAGVYRLIDDGVIDNSWELAETQQVDPQQQPPDMSPPEALEQELEGGVDVNEYESLELPPFMTPVMEELMKQQQETGNPRETPQAEGEPDQPGDSGERPMEDEADGTMSTTEAQRGGETSEDDVAQAAQGESQEEAPPGVAADSRADDKEGGSDSPVATTGSDVPVVEQEADEELGEKTFTYDEWDFKIDDYRPSWCTLREQRLLRTQEGFVAATFHEYGGIVSQIRRNFQLMRPERLRKMRYQVEGDDLDTDGLVEYVVDRRARVAPTGRVYIKRDKTERDVTTAFLVDMSSSTDRKIDGRKRIIDIEKEGLLLMSEALEAIRDEYAIYGFSGSGREECEFYVVKEIGERYDDRIKARIGGIYARQKTRMGPAIRHATRRLQQADSAVKLMILLTDGKPYDSDTYQDNQYAQEDTKMALREARREKIHLFCVTVDREGGDYLPHMYSDANYVIIDDIRTLPQRLPQLYRRLTT